MSQINVNPAPTGININPPAQPNAPGGGAGTGNNPAPGGNNSGTGTGNNPPPANP